MKDFKEKKRILEHELNYLVKITDKLIEPLKKFDEKQIAIVNILLWQVQSITQGSILLGKRGEAIVDQFNTKLTEICPDPPKVELTGDPCFDATVGYLSALKECEEEGKQEEECDEAHGYMGPLVNCAMAKIDEAKGKIDKIHEGLGLPKPRPLPEL